MEPSHPLPIRKLSRQRHIPRPIILPIIHAITLRRQRYIARPFATPTIFPITLRAPLRLRGIIIRVNARALPTATAPPPLRALRNNRLSELGAGTAQVASRVDYGEGEQGEEHGRCFKAVEVGFVGWDGAVDAGGELDEAEDDADLGRLVGLFVWERWGLRTEMRASEP